MALPIRAEVIMLEPGDDHQTNNCVGFILPKMERDYFVIWEGVASAL